MPTCPEGHDTPSTDFCDVCGIRLDAPAPPQAQAGPAAGACPRCGAERSVCDPGSANGTLVNGQALPAGARVRLRDGDRVCLGAWTMLTIQAA